MTGLPVHLLLAKWQVKIRVVMTLFRANVLIIAKNSVTGQPTLR
jgi:hypothetical protein